MVSLWSGECGERRQGARVVGWGWEVEVEAAGVFLLLENQTESH